jgi:hypothetical protein
VWWRCNKVSKRPHVHKILRSASTAATTFSLNCYLPCPMYQSLPAMGCIKASSFPIARSTIVETVVEWAGSLSSNRLRNFWKGKVLLDWQAVMVSFE